MTPQRANKRSPCDAAAVSPSLSTTPPSPYYDAPPIDINIQHSSPPQPGSLNETADLRNVRSTGVCVCVYSYMCILHTSCTNKSRQTTSGYSSRQTRGGVSQQANRQHKNTHRLGQSLLCHLRHRKSTTLAKTRSHETFSSRPPRTVQSSSPARFLQGKSPLTTLGLQWLTVMSIRVDTRWAWP